MKTTDEKKAMLQALANIREKSLEGNRFSSSQMNKFDLERGRNTAKGQLDNDVLKVKSTPQTALPENQAIKGTATKINTVGEKQSLISGADFKRKQQLSATMKDAIKRGDKGMISKLQQIAGKLGKGASKGLKSIPIIGSLAALAGSEDASAAVPGLDSAESVGMSGAAENQMMAEIQGRKDYATSQAAEDAKRNKLAVLAKLAELKENQ